MAVLQLPMNRVGGSSRPARHRRSTQLRDHPVHRAAIEFSTHLLYCASYADDVFAPMADALGSAAFDVARVSGEGGASSDALARKARAAVGILDLAREMDAVPQDVERVTRRLSGRLIGLLEGVVEAGGADGAQRDEIKVEQKASGG
jgi:hypothetical protein